MIVFLSKETDDGFVIWYMYYMCQAKFINLAKYLYPDSIHTLAHDQESDNEKCAAQELFHTTSRADRCTQKLKKSMIYSFEIIFNKRSRMLRMQDMHDRVYIYLIYFAHADC